ncbi:MAG: class I SAM-dependent methyltransferase [Chloroflexi bacterium]|nr:MAG: class I SAM-dependent methyltransferase [Chloroflexota bacterium]
MDDISNFNQSKWDELVRKGVLYARPLLNLTPDTAREWLDPHGMLDDVSGKMVLCLASGGGKQSAAFGVLGAQVHVLDLSAEMLARDRQAADHYGYPVDLQHGDMRDLSRFADRSFDIVFQAYSINFVPDPRPVFREVARVIRPGGLYHLQFHNPFFMGMGETDWTGSAYPLTQPYINGAEIDVSDWEFEDKQGRLVKMPGPREFRHTFSAVFNQLIEMGFLLAGFQEEVSQDATAAPGTWEHFLSLAPPWLFTWFSYRPGIL